MAQWGEDIKIYFPLESTKKQRKRKHQKGQLRVLNVILFVEVKINEIKLNKQSASPSVDRCHHYYHVGCIL